jgi:two-component system response regulator FlrC
MKPVVLIVEDDLDLREALVDTLELSGYATLAAENGRVALQIIDESHIDLVVSDVQMDEMDGHTLLKNIKSRRTDLPVLLMTAYGTIQNAIKAIQDGAVDYLVKPFESTVLVSKVAQIMPQALASEDGVIATDPVFKKVLDMARRVGPSDATVLITGESGTGKEVLFRYLHNHSDRRDKDPVAINCAAIPDNMLEAILFGYEKGAFTGAYKASPGKFEQAEGSTILLDEISEMDLSLHSRQSRY